MKQAGNTTFAPAQPVSQTITVIPQSNADFTISPNVQSLTLRPGTSGTVTVTLTSSGGFGSQVSFNCGESTLATCSFAPPSLTPSGVPSTTTLTVTPSGTVARLQHPAMRWRLPPGLASGTLFVSFAMVVVLIGGRRPLAFNQRLVGALYALLTAFIISISFGCGGSPTTSVSSQPQTGVITVSASAASNNGHSFSLMITVNP